MAITWDAFKPCMAPGQGVNYDPICVFFPSLFSGDARGVLVAYAWSWVIKDGLYLVCGTNSIYLL